MVPNNTHTRLTCPDCGGGNVRRSRSTPLDRLLSVRGYRPYRCRSCDVRFRSLVTDRSDRHARSGERQESRKRRMVVLRRELVVYGFALLAFAVIAFVATRESF